MIRTAAGNPGFGAIASSANAPLAGMADESRRFYGLQFHPEVTHTEFGGKLLANFVKHICGCRGTWQISSFIEREVAAKYDVDFIPTSDWMCTALVCPVIVGNVLMYRDDSHITSTASEFLAPYVERALLHAMT